MAKTLVELTTEIVKAHAASTSLSPEELLVEMERVHDTLKKLDSGETTTAHPAPVIDPKDSFQGDHVVCLLCGKSFTTLSRHLNQTHNMKPKQYRKQFGIPASQPLTSRAFSASRRKMAADRNLMVEVAFARQARAERLSRREQAAA